MNWIEHLPELRRMKQAKVTYAAIGLHFGVTRQAVSGAVRRHIYNIHDTKGRTTGGQRARPGGMQSLIEPWTQLHARKQKERETAKASLQVVQRVREEPR